MISIWQSVSLLFGESINVVVDWLPGEMCWVVNSLFGESINVVVDWLPGEMCWVVNSLFFLCAEFVRNSVGFVSWLKD